MAGRVNRVTMFKMPDPASQKKLLEAFDVMLKAHSKDGKPYILYLSAGVAEQDARSQGFTVVSKTEFASLDDMKFYDDECVAHKALKKTAAGLGLAEMPLTVYYYGEPQFTLSA